MLSANKAVSHCTADSVQLTDAELDSHVQSTTQRRLWGNDLGNLESSVIFGESGIVFV